MAAVKTAQNLGPGHRIVTILCDSGTRHLSKFWARAGNVGGMSGMTLERVLKPETPLETPFSAEPGGY